MNKQEKSKTMKPVGRIILFDDRRDAIEFVVNYMDLFYRNGGYRSDDVYTKEYGVDGTLFFTIFKDDWPIIERDGVVEEVNWSLNGKNKFKRVWRYKKEA